MVPGKCLKLVLEVLFGGDVVMLCSDAFRPCCCLRRVEIISPVFLC